MGGGTEAEVGGLHVLHTHTHTHTYTCTYTHSQTRVFHVFLPCVARATRSQITVTQASLEVFRAKRVLGAWPADCPPRLHGRVCSLWRHRRAHTFWSWLPLMYGITDLDTVPIPLLGALMPCGGCECLVGWRVGWSGHALLPQPHISFGQQLCQDGHVNQHARHV